MWRVLALVLLACRAACAQNISDAEVLLALKATFENGEQLLPTWNDSVADACQWAPPPGMAEPLGRTPGQLVLGVGCDQDGRVTAV